MRSFLIAFALVVAGCAADGLPLVDSPSPGGPIGGSADLRGAPPSDLGAPGMHLDLAPAPPPDLGHGDGGGDGGGGGGGTPFQPATTVKLPAGFTGESVAIGDVTGDGRADVVVGASAIGTVNSTVVFVFRQTAAGQLAAPVSYAILDRGAPAPDTVDVGDLDGDGRLDVVVARLNDVGVLYQNAAGGLDAVRALTATQAGNGEEIVQIADFNGDGRADLVATGWASSGVDVWFQTAQGMLDGPHSFACPHNGYDDIAVADFNDDGLVDLALGSGQAFQGCLLLQAPGGFAPYIPVTFGKSITAIGAGDLDGDGRDDLAAAGGGNSPDGHFGVARQRADGTLGAFDWMASYDIPGDLLVADVDGDGRKDAIVLHTGWSTVGLYRQTATGTLGAEERIPFSYINWGTDRMAVGDINGDGKPDLVAADGGLTILYHR